MRGEGDEVETEKQKEDEEKEKSEIDGKEERPKMGTKSWRRLRMYRRGGRKRRRKRARKME
jgi:hypothetical protein